MSREVEYANDEMKPSMPPLWPSIGKPSTNELKRPVPYPEWRPAREARDVVGCSMLLRYSGSITRSSPISPQFNSTWTNLPRSAAVVCRLPDGLR
jgi:hypothetical protein